VGVSSAIRPTGKSPNPGRTEREAFFAGFRSEAASGKLWLRNRPPRSLVNVLLSVFELLRAHPGGSLENAQPMAAHESPRTTKLDDRTGDEITLDEVEQIKI